MFPNWQPNLGVKNGKNPGFTSLYSKPEGLEPSHVKPLYMGSLVSFINKVLC